MNKARCFVLITGVILSLVMITRYVNAEYVIDEKETLRDVKSIYVTVEYLDSEDRRFGLTEEKLKTDVELKCRLAGIKISEDSLERLYINVNPVYTESDNNFSFGISIEFKQRVSLLRKQNLSCTATTWNKGAVGVVSARKMEQVIRNSVKDLVDIFLNDYFAVNPKK